MKTTCIIFILFLSSVFSNAALVVEVNAAKSVGTKKIIPMTLKNTFKEKIESARATVFLMDDKGKMVGQATRWVIGGTKEKPALAADAETTFNFVIETDKSFTTTKVIFTRIILEGGKIADIKNAYEIQK